MASAIAAAERRVMHSRRELRAALRRLRLRVSRPSFVAGATLAAGLLAFWPAGRRRLRALAGMLASLALRRALVR